VNLGGTFSFFIGVAIRFVEISSNSRLKKKKLISQSAAHLACDRSR
jgi:hypothetical protein